MPCHRHRGPGRAGGGARGGAQPRTPCCQQGSCTRRVGCNWGGGSWICEVLKGLDFAHGINKHNCAKWPFAEMCIIVQHYAPQFWFCPNGYLNNFCLNMIIIQLRFFLIQQSKFPENRQSVPRFLRITFSNFKCFHTHMLAFWNLYSCALIMPIVVNWRRLACGSVTECFLGAWHSCITVSDSL